MRYLKSTVMALMACASATAFAATDTTADTSTDASQAAITSKTTTTTTQVTTSATTNQNPKLGKMTCREFTVLDETMRPKVIYWAVGHFKGKKTEILNAGVIDGLVPIVVEECTAHPDQSFWKTLKEKAKGMF